MSEMVELVAKAIYEARYGSGSWDLLAQKPNADLHMNTWRNMVAAIEAAGYRIVKEEEPWSSPGPDSSFYDANATVRYIPIDKLYVDVVLPERHLMDYDKMSDILKKQAIDEYDKKKPPAK